MSITVTNLNDSGLGSLRQAILDANALNGADIITFDPSLSGQTITLASGELQITDDITIDGDLNDDEAPDITIERDDSADPFRIFNIDDGNNNPDKTVDLDGLVIKGGLTIGEDESGGGIASKENLSLSNSIVSGNSTRGNRSNGGGISSLGDYYGPFPNLTVTNSTISGNSTAGDRSDGGGIAARYSNLAVNNSIIHDNFTTGYRSNGGGLHTRGAYSGDSSILTVSSSTISGNSTKGSGGGFWSGISTITVTDSIITENSADSTGGGIGNFLAGLTVNNSIISSNSSDSDGGGIGNIYAGALFLNNSTISGNSANGNGGGLFNGIYSGLRSYAKIT